jgi:hypothetical protein
MREVDLQKVDLNLLHALRALLEEQHVTRAANRIFLSQPAMSRAFERLREMFADNLLCVVDEATNVRFEESTCCES